MVSTTLDRGEELRELKLRTSKGIGLLTTCLLGMLGIIGVVFWLAAGLAPTAEGSRNVFHEPPERPAGAVDDPRERDEARPTSGDR